MEKGDWRDRPEEMGSLFFYVGQEEIWLWRAMEKGDGRKLETSEKKMGIWEENIGGFYKCHSHGSPMIEVPVMDLVSCVERNGIPGN